MRGLVAIATSLLGYVDLAHSIGYTIKSRDPDVAYALASYDGRVTAALARQRMADSRTVDQRASAERLARLALQQDPTAVGAAVVLGQGAQLRGNAVQAQKWFGYSQALSRRDLPTDLWAIEDAVGRNDVPGALLHYDIALRTSPEASALLFPVLSKAIADPTIRAGLLSTLAKRPPWSKGFLISLADNGADPRSIVILFDALRRAHLPVPPDAASNAVDQLVSSGAVSDAWRYYASIRPEVRRNASRDPQFAAELATPSVFDWVPNNDDQVSVSILRGGMGGIVDFTAPTGNGGTLLRQMQYLPPGAYRLEGHSIGIDQPQQSLPYWLLTCRDGRELGRVIVPGSAQADGAFAGPLTVPADCPVQMMSLVARPSTTAAGLAGQIDRVRLISAE